jgi:hypothetical protein
MADAGSEASTLDLLRGIQAHGSAEGRSLTCALSGVGTAAPITISTSFSFPNFVVFTGICGEICWAPADSESDDRGLGEGSRA